MSPLSGRPPTPGKISESAAPSECALMPSSTATAASSDNGTRCSARAFIRDAGMRHSRAQGRRRPMSPREPRRTVPRQRREAERRLDDRTGPGRLDRRQRGGNVRDNDRRCSRVFGVFGNAASITSPAAFTSTCPMPAVAAHFRALPCGEVGRALDLIEASRASLSAKACLRFAALTACRSGEARGARWDEVDLESRKRRMVRPVRQAPPADGPVGAVRARRRREGGALASMT